MALWSTALRWAAQALRCAARHGAALHGAARRGAALR
jgi:hypothetical protein